MHVPGTSIAAARPLPVHPIIWLGISAIAIGAAAAAVTTVWYVALLPLFAGLAVISFLWPRTGVFIFIATLYVRVSLPGLSGKYAADLVAFLIIGGVIVQRLVTGRRIFDRAWLTPTLVVILGAFALSLPGAFNLQGGVINWVRHAQLFALILAVLTCMKPEDRIYMVRWLLIMTSAVSLYNVGVFVASGGQLRVFGIAGQFFSLYSALAMIHACIGTILGRTIGHRLGWLFLLIVNFGGLIATQTRAAMMQAIIGLLLLVVIVFLWSRRQGESAVIRRIVNLMVTVIILVAVLFSGVLPILQGPSTRILSALEGHSGTVALRIFLWRIALQLFKDSPVFGIGLAQTSTVYQWLPEWHFQPLASRTSSMGSHNDFLDYLACTGIVGMLPLLWLLWRMLKSGVYQIARTYDKRELSITLHLWLPIASMALSFFFKENIFYSLSGMMTVLYFAMWLKHTQLPGGVYHIPLEDSQQRGAPQRI